MTSQAWIELFAIYLGCWVFGRLIASADQRDGMGTRTLTGKTKLMLFLLPKTKLQTFTLRSIIYMAIVNGILLVQLILAAVNFFVPGKKLVCVIDRLGAVMILILFIYICITVLAAMIHGFRQWRQERQLRKEIKQNGGLFFEKDDSIQVPEYFVVKAPKSVLYIGLASILFWAVIITLMTLFPNDTADLWVYAIFSILLVLGAWLSYFAIRWRITVNRDIIQLTPLLGGKKTYYVSEITAAVFKNRTQALVVYKDSKKLFDLAFYYIESVTFAGYLQQAGIKIEIKI